VRVSHFLCCWSLPQFPVFLTRHPDPPPRSLRRRTPFPGEDEELTLIDFPQMVSTTHANGEELFVRDVECIVRFFSKKIG
jgi:hypothetical protein